MAGPPPFRFHEGFICEEPIPFVLRSFYSLVLAGFVWRRPLEKVVVLTSFPLRILRFNSAAYI